MLRITKDEYYLGIAEAVLVRSTCLRRRYGAVIVKDDEIVSTGYNGAPRGRKNCTDCGYCDRQAKGIAHNTDYSSCRSVHAEANAIISASRNDMLGGTLYLFGVGAETGEPINNAECCPMCKRLIINAGIRKVITSDGAVQVRDWVYNDDSLKGGMI